MAKTKTETRIDAKAYLKDRDAALEAARKRMGIETLETRRSDALDFHDLAVWTVRDAVADAFDAGYEHAERAKANLINSVVAVLSARRDAMLTCGEWIDLAKAVEEATGSPAKNFLTEADLEWAGKASRKAVR